MFEMALRTASDAREGVSSLPVDVTSFVGRRTQIADAKRLLSGARLLTLTGPGGVGKTRLALRVAYAVRRAFGDGVRFVELAELREPSLLAYAVAEKLGLQDRPFQSALETIVEHLQPREVLLVLDNCEHMAEDTALFVDAVLGACPQVRILATSRQPLEAYGETTLVVPPLPVPEPDVALSPDALMLYDSVALFAERARAVLPGFDVRSQDCAVLARVCRDLDGIPLAIELAVVWLRALSLDQIAERLSERFRLLARGPRNVPRGSGRCGRWSSGAMTCARSRRNGSGLVRRCFPVVSIWRRWSMSAVARRRTVRRWLTQSAPWSTSPF